MNLANSNAARYASVALLLPVFALVGCGKPYRIAEVDGVLTIHDRPADKVQVQFVPDGSKSTIGPSSFGETDAQGHFTLEYNDGTSPTVQPGAVVGWHHVALTDLKLAASDTGAGVTMRFGTEYMTPGSSPLGREVKDGKQTIEIKLP